MFTWVVFPFYVDEVCAGGRISYVCSDVAALHVTFPVLSVCTKQSAAAARNRMHPSLCYKECSSKDLT